MYLKKKFNKAVFLLIAVLIVFCIPAYIYAEGTTSGKIPTTIKWSNPTNASFGPMSSYGIIITLTDDNGNLLEDKTISWETAIAYFYKPTTKTDAKGSSTNELKIAHANRNTAYTVDVVIKFAGDDVYESSTLNVSLSCYDTATPTSETRIYTSIYSVNIDNGPYGPFGTNELKVVLKDNNGNPLAGKTLYWSSSNEVGVSRQTATTDENGIAVNNLCVGHEDKNRTYNASVQVEYAGDQKYCSARCYLSVSCYDTGTPEPPASTTPAPTNRPPTPEVKRTPGPTEVDVVHNIDGCVFSEDKVPLYDFNVTLLGSHSINTSRTDGLFSDDTCYNCGEVRISKPGFLTREIMLESVLDKMYNPPSIVLFAGDINQDNAINMSDIMEIASAFNTNQKSTNFNKICDFNNDDAINLADIMIVAKRFNATPADYNSIGAAFSESRYKIDLTVEPAQQITKDGAYIKGGIYRVDDYGPITPIWIEYWEENAPSKVMATNPDMIFYYPDFIARTLAGLKAGATYNYRVCSGLGFSETKSFTTLSD